jgi:diguanylate cyclase (GGDEF)-like protein
MRASRTGLHVAVLFLDLDHFKTINDTFGHSTGDSLLIQVGQRIQALLRTSDTLARMGGDEFAIQLTDLAHPDEAVSVALKINACLQDVFDLKHNHVYSGTSIGLAFYPDDAADSDTLLRYADMAMYQAKNGGRGGYACYSQEMDSRTHEDMLLHTKLKEAIVTGGLSLHYQPQVDVKSNRIVGAEALLRWYDPVLGNVSPERFIPVAEATGLMLPLSDWILKTACEQIAAWTKSGTPLRVAVNCSAQQFHLRRLHEKVSNALMLSGAQAQWLEIEITESVAMTHAEQAREQINALVAQGCSVALDDFGTGYSSLAYLKALPVSKLKIDKSFMDGIPFDASDATISRAIIALAHSLGMTLVAEGVETDGQLAFLRQYNCEVYQGWLYAKAMPAEDLTQRLLAQQQEGLATHHGNARAAPPPQAKPSTPQPTCEAEAGDVQAMATKPKLGP